jgi:hypothetical protein
MDNAELEIRLTVLQDIEFVALLARGRRVIRSMPSKYVP